MNKICHPLGAYQVPGISVISFILQQPHEASPLSRPMLQMQKLRLKQLHHLLQALQQEPILTGAWSTLMDPRARANSTVSRHPQRILKMMPPKQAENAIRG